MKILLLAATALLAAPIAQASTLVVTEAADSVANNGRCSLREAITAANTGLPSGAAVGECGQGVAAPYDRIDVPAGDYRLERAGTGEDDNANGDLDIRSANLELRGAGAAQFE
ncbi:MAG TPA: CSLREA domain-containing protein, partial [Tahibacter sp.]|nr:CSLREA domain-containing protein [Tahibacter sp.]